MPPLGHFSLIRFGKLDTAAAPAVPYEDAAAG